MQVSRLLSFALVRRISSGYFFFPRLSFTPLFSSNFPFFYSPPLPFDSLFFFFICTATSFSAGTLYPVKLVNFLTANGGVVGLKSFHYHLVSFLAGKCSRCCSRCVTIDTETAFLSSFLLLFFFFSLLFTLFPDVDPFQFDANI